MNTNKYTLIYKDAEGINRWTQRDKWEPKVIDHLLITGCHSFMLFPPSTGHPVISHTTSKE